MNVQKRPRSSIRARRTACFSVSSSSRYMSLTSCRALSSWGCRSPFPGGGWEERPRWGRRPGSLHPWLRPCGGVPGHGAGHCRGGQGAGQGSRDSGACGGAGPQSRQRGQTNMHTGKTPKLQSHPEPGTGRQSWAVPGPPLAQPCSREPSGDLHSSWDPPSPPCPYCTGQPHGPRDGALWPPGKRRQCGSRTR